MTATDILKSFGKIHISAIVLISALSAVGGAALGAKVALDKYGAKIREEADEALKVEIASAKEFYRTLNKKEGFSTPEEALESLHPETTALVNAARALTDYQGASASRPNENLKEVSRNVFTDAKLPEPFDYDQELLRRDPDRPYLITDEEFNEAGPDYEQVSFTYYEGDGVLANVQDQTIDDIENTVGADNLMRFGDGSGDENIVYIRNVKLEMDIELSRSTGKYSVEVAGLEDSAELRHGDDRRVLRKFRHSDE